MNPVHPTSSKATWPNRATSPREPLYTLEEIAQRLGMTMQSLIAWMKDGNTLRPWQVHAETRSTKKRVMYRMSDAKRWLTVLETR